MRFDPIIQKIKKLINNKRIWNVHVFCGSYLPDWKPERDYQKSYNANKKKGGGVLLDLSHELDYTKWLFGLTKLLYVNFNKKSDLLVNVEDTAIVIAKNNQNTLININLNYYTRKPVRQIFIDGENISIQADLIQKKLIYHYNGIKKENKFNNYNRNYTYEKQHQSILSNKIIVCKLTEGKNIMKLIDDIKYFKN